MYSLLGGWNHSWCDGKDLQKAVACGAREKAANDRPICYTRMLPALVLLFCSSKKSLSAPFALSNWNCFHREDTVAVDGGRLGRRSLPLMVLLDCKQCNLQPDQQCGAVMYPVYLRTFWSFRLLARFCLSHFAVYSCRFPRWPQRCSLRFASIVCNKIKERKGTFRL